MFLHLALSFVWITMATEDIFFAVKDRASVGGPRAPHLLDGARRDEG
jgi:hypothetical protein